MPCDLFWPMGCGLQGQERAQEAPHPLFQRLGQVLSLHHDFHTPAGLKQPQLWPHSSCGAAWVALSFLTQETPRKEAEKGPRPSCPEIVPRPSCPEVVPRPSCPEVIPRPSCPEAVPRPSVFMSPPGGGPAPGGPSSLQGHTHWGPVCVHGAACACSGV